MKRFIPLLGLITVLFSCNKTSNETSSTTAPKKNEVLVLGTIHNGHLEQDAYDIDVLTSLIKTINPDVILTEIPPGRFDQAMNEFQEKDTITEPRVVRFPEYVDVIFPLSKEMDFEIIPTAGWTKAMADKRSDQLKAISEDSNRADEWEELNRAEAKSDSLIKASGREFDPYWINSDVYDQLVDIELQVYNRLFNDELGPGGWDNINKSHYGYISAALDSFQFQGKRILITYGAGHKGWFLRELKKRQDIKLISLDEAMATNNN